MVKKATLTYCHFGALNVGASGSTVYNIFDLASIQDPDVSGVGHQPYGHDELSAIYSEWCVIGARIQVIWRSLNTTQPYYAGVYCYPTRESASSHVPNSDPLTVVESGFGPSCVITGNNVDERKSLSINVNVSKFLNLSPNKDTTVWTPFGNTPPANQTCFCFVWAGNPNGAGVSGEYYVKISYTVLCRKLDMFPQS